MIKNDFDLITHNFEKQITIVPIGDVHLGNKDCQISNIKKLINYIAETPNVYCTLGGDIIDNGILYGKNIGVLEQVKTPMEQIKTAVELFKPLADKGKILCIISGNHEQRSEKCTGLNGAYLMACELGLTNIYRNNMAIMKILIGTRKNNKKLGRHQTYTILVHHGKGSAESAIKKDHDFMNYFSGLDIITTHHTHNGRCAKFKQYEINKFKNKVVEKNVTVIVANSFLKDADYGIKNMLIGANNEIISYELRTGNEKKVIVHF